MSDGDSGSVHPTADDVPREPSKGQFFRSGRLSEPAGDGIKTSTEGGVAGSHPPAEPFRLRLAPSTEAGAQNLARLRLIPIACWRVDDFRFQFDSSFVLPEVRAEM